MFSLFSLEIIWNFVSPLAKDLLRAGGKKLLTKSTQTTKPDFYNLYEALGDFDIQLKLFIEELSKFISDAEKRGNQIRLKWYHRSKLGKAGSNLKNSLDKLGEALEKVDPYSTRRR